MICYANVKISRFKRNFTFSSTLQDLISSESSFHTLNKIVVTIFPRQPFSSGSGMFNLDLLLVIAPLDSYYRNLARLAQAALRTTYFFISKMLGILRFFLKSLIGSFPNLLRLNIALMPLFIAT